MLCLGCGLVSFRTGSGLKADFCENGNELCRIVRVAEFVECL